ncbi:MAG: replicative DNA helicase [Pyrinomonadaceae bacterium]
MDSTRDQLLEKPLPHSAESERAILGAVILDNGLVNQAIELLKPDDFYVQSHRRVFQAMTALSERGAEINSILLGEELRRDAVLDQVGGLTFITNLTYGLPHFSNIGLFAKIVRDKSMLRQLIRATNKITSEALEEEDEAEVILDHAEQAIFALADERTRQGFTHVKPIADTLLEKVQEMAGRSAMLTGLATGFTELDSMTSGLQPSDLIIVAARPSMGKCLAHDSEITLADGSIASIEDIYRSQRARLLTLDNALKFRVAEPSCYVDDGLKPVYRVTTRLGRMVESTLSHPFLTVDGWQPLYALKAGVRIAVPRNLAVFGESEMRECEVKLLAYLIGDGCLTRSSPIFTVGKPALADDFRWAVGEFGGVEAVPANSARRTFSLRIRGTRKGVRSNPVTLWLRSLGLYGRNSHHKFVPPQIFKLRRQLIALFLNRLFATDGWATVLASGQAQLGFASTSEKLTRQVQHLLLRYGVIAALRKRSVKYRDERREAWQLDITDARSIKIFVEQIGIHGKPEALAAVSAALELKKYQTNRDLVPASVWSRLAQHKGKESWFTACRAGLKNCSNIHVGRRSFTRDRLLTFASALESESLAQLAESEVYRDEIVSISEAGVKQVYDLTIPETHNFVANDICVHNTSLCLTLAQNAAIQGQAVVGVFSLEMSKESLVMRMLCSEGRVDAHRFRSGFLSREEWTRLAGALGSLADARIFIDDTPGITVLEMRAKARRLASEQKKLDLIIVDYMQLMSGSSRRSESRQQEVSQISRELKGLAKELNVPLIALSQLSRAPEARTDHRPQLADLRECIVGDSVITNPITGCRQTIAELFKLQQSVPVYSLDGDLKLTKTVAAKVVQSGEKQVHLLRTESGREIRASANHPFLTIDGWRQLDALEFGTEIAVPRRYPQMSVASDLHPDRARLLGYLVSDGSYARHRTVSFISNDPIILADARRICVEQFGFEPRDKAHWSGTPQLDFSVRGQYGPGKNPLIKWLKEIGIHGETTSHKRVPDVIFGSSTESISEFLAGLYAGDGSIVKRPDRFIIKYTSTSRRLLHEIHSLLLRFGITAKLTRPTRHSKSTVDIADLIVEGKERTLSFASSVPLIGRKGELLKAAATWASIGQTKAHHDRLPLAVLEEIQILRTERGLSWQKLGYRCQGKRIGRQHLRQVAAVLGAARLALLAKSDIYWDRVVEITPVGREMTYDLMVPGTHNFVVNDIIVHNSGAIEQDADVVAFIYREEQYNRTEENAGIAELIVAKQRNGPTGTVKLAFLKEFTRFENMWRE